MAEADLRRELALAAEANRVLRRQNEELILRVENFTKAEEIKTLRVENQALRTNGRVRIKIGDKRGVVVRHTGGFPTTLFKDQWLLILDAADQIRAFIRDNDSKLKASAAFDEPISPPKYATRRAK